MRYTFATRNTEDTLNTIAHIYWDQATSVLVQLGLLDARTLPVAGVETARKALDPTL